MSAKQEFHNITISDHLIFGAGLIGCYLGAVLTACKEQSQTVTLLTRQKVAEQLSSGISLTDYQNNKLELTQLSTAVDSADIDASFDVIWLTVKCISIAAAIDDLRQFVKPTTIIICCQNGLGSEQLVKQAFSENIVLRAMVPFNVVNQSDNHFHRGSEGHLTIESSCLDAHLKSALTKDSVNSGSSTSLLPLAFTEDMTAMQWAKLQLNLGNSVNALANIPVKSMLEQRQFRLVIAAMMKELLAVTDAMGIQLPKVTSVPAHWIPRILSLPNFLFTRVAAKMLAIDPTVRTSMWWDLQQGRKTEIDYLNGVVVANAEKYSTQCRVNQTIIKHIKNAEQQASTQRQTYSAVQLATELGIMKS